MGKDLYTKNFLKKQYMIHQKYTLERKKYSTKLKINFRMPSIPEDISENIIKYIIHKNGDKTSRWNCKGDLMSDIEKKQECKCFTSKGPISFTPSSNWNSIYFLDATEWLKNKFKLYKFPYSRTSIEWKNIKVNKTQSFENQCDQGRRPRINWNALYPQIKNKCFKIYEGNILTLLNR
jgi:hypothetical protein